MDKGEGPAVLTVAEVAQRLRLHANQVYAATASGEVPSIRIGRRVLIPRAAFEKMLAGAGASPPGRRP